MRRSIIAVLSLIAFVMMFFLMIGLKSHRETFAREENEREGTSGAMQAMDFWTRSRAYPDRDIPADKYYRAFQSSKNKQNGIREALTAGGAWDPLGPSNLQGRTISVALNPLNPYTTFVGTASGGLWRSYSGGLAGDWKRVKLGFPALGIGAILIDPVDTNVIYLGTGEVYGYQTENGGVVIRTMRGSYGIGILKTTDGGQTWSKSLDWSYNAKTGVQAMKMNPLNHRSIWAATTEGLYESYDAGATWHVVLGTILAEDIVINPLDTNLILASFGDLNSPGTGVYRTSNSGSSWAMVSGLPAYQGKTLLEMYAAHPNVVYASVADSSVVDNGGLWRSTDFGNTWVLFNTPTNLFQVQGWYSHFVAVHPTDSSQVVHAGVPIYKSIDGGRTFFSSSGVYSDNHAYAHHPINPNILYVVDDDGVYRSDDFGGSFINVGTGMQTGQFYNGFSCSRTDSLLALGQSQDHIPGYRYLGSLAWDHGSVVDEAGWTGINQIDDNLMFAVDRFGGNMYRSTDRGATFSWLTGFDGSGAWNSPFVLSPSSDGVIYFGDIHVHKTTNAGYTWSIMNSSSPIDLSGNPILSMAISATHSDTVYVGTAPVYAQGHIYFTPDGGDSWLDVTGDLPDRYPMDIAVDPLNSQTVYVAFGGFGSGHLYKSTDAGANWTDFTGTLPDAPTTSIAIDPLHTNIVYVGNDLGVYVSTNGGGTWSTFNEGLPEAAIAADLTISPSNRALRVATHGNGVWERKLLMELPSNYFDYKAAALNSPMAGSRCQAGVAFPIRATFRNLSAQTETDSFDVRYQIVHAGSVIYATTNRIGGLAVGEERSVAFGSFAFPDTGYFELQAISLATDMNSHDDTLRGLVAVVPASTISTVIVSKQYSLYTEITGGSAGPSGDDNQSIAVLPFIFSYDGYNYDRVQISTNGWLELGTGAPGSPRGLSTVSQLGGFFRTAQADTERPTKVLGPWWTDMSTNGSVGQITYKVLGSAPNRVFVVQWKNILANYNASTTTTFLNFQVKLYETSNLIDFVYGPLIAGSFPSDASGASIDIKDYIGGDYRYYDIAGHGTGLAGALISSLNPLRNWPGSDSCYRIKTQIVGRYGVANGWNIVSVPLAVSNHNKANLFPSAVSHLFGYQGGYVDLDTIANGVGYWLKFSGDQNVSLIGFLQTQDSIAVQPGWNLIGSIGSAVLANSIGSTPGPIITSQFFGYDRGYYAADTIQPGKGYWVKVHQTGSLILSSSGEMMPATRVKIEPTEELPPPPPEPQSPSGAQIVPHQFALEQNYPNPFNPVTLIRYELPAQAYVRLSVYDMLGREVSRLVDGVQEAGYKSAEWNPSDNRTGLAAGGMSSGVYFYRIEATGIFSPSKPYVEVKKMLLVR